jgi:ribosome modulation factor
MTDKEEAVLKTIEALLIAGQDAYLAGRPKGACPYPRLSWEAGLWEEGYDEAEMSARSQLAYDEGRAAAAFDLAPPLPYPEMQYSRLQEAWLDGFVAGAYCLTTA